MAKIIGIAPPEGVLFLPSDKQIQIGNEGMGWDEIAAAQSICLSRQASEGPPELAKSSGHKPDSGNERRSTPRRGRS
jgi:hypothetical protein